MPLPVPTRRPVDLVCREGNRCRDASGRLRGATGRLCGGPPLHGHATARARRDRPGRPPARPRGLMATTASAPPGPGARASRLRRFHRPPDRRRAVPARPQTLGDGLARSHGHAVPGGRPGLARLPVVPSGNARTPRVADRGRGHAEASRAVPHHVGERGCAPGAPYRRTRHRPGAVERMFDATRGAHVSPGELEHLWRGQPGPPADRSWPDPAGAWYCPGIDWAQTRDSTVAAVVRCETTPFQLVAVYRAKRRPWPMMAAQVGALLDEYPGPAGGTR